jgi:hypothetical protein
MTAVPRDLQRHDRSTAFLIFGLLLACYLLTFTGRIDSSDGLSMFATTESLVRRGAFDSNQLLWMGNQQGNIGTDGDLYTRKGIGMVLLGYPLVWFARQWPAIGLVHAALLLNPIITAWTGALLFRAGRRLGWSRNTSVATALIFGLATMAWPYTQGYFSDPICAWGLFAAAYGMLAYAQSGRKLYLLGAGAAWAIAYLTRTINLLTLPVYLAALFFVLESVHRPPPGGILARLRAAYWRDWRPVVSFLIPVVVAGLISLWWNWARFGSPWETGYVESESFTADWLFGFFGLTLGPARGFFWYNPILLLAIPGAFWFWRRQRRILFIALAIVAIYFVVYAKWYMWHGGYSWGPRFLVPVVPFLSLLAGPGWEQLMTARALGRLGWVIGGLLTLLSVAVQWLGMLVPYALVQDWLAASVQPLFAPETFTRIAYSPLVLQWQFLQTANIQFAWWRGGPWPNAVDWLGLAIPIAGVIAGIWMLFQQRHNPHDDENDSVRNWLYAGALGIIALAMLTYLLVALGDPEARLMARRIEQGAARGDAVLHLQPLASQEFANHYQGRLPVYGLFDRDALPPDEQAWLERMRGTANRLWVIPDYRPPDESGWERQLRTDDFLLLDDRVSGPGNQRIALYALAAGQQLDEAGLGTVFGDPGAATPVTEESGWFRLNGYALTPESTPGGVMLVTLLWESLRPVDANYQVFVHLLDAQGNKVAQRDGQPVQWLRPTSTWLPGEEIADRYGLLLPETFPTGSYTIAVGLYDPVTGQRLPVSAGPTSYAIELGPIEVR